MGALVLFRGTGGGSDKVYSGLNLTDTAGWHYVSVAYNADTSSPYIRFILDDQTTNVTKTLGTRTNAKNLHIGHHNGVFFDGLIDEVRISNTFLPVDQLLNARPRGTVLILR